MTACAFSQILMLFLKYELPVGYTVLMLAGIGFGAALIPDKKETDNYRLFKLAAAFGCLVAGMYRPVIGMACSVLSNYAMFDKQTMWYKSMATIAVFTAVDIFNLWSVYVLFGSFCFYLVY